MADFYSNLDGALAIEVEQLSRLVYELREHRRSVLGAFNATDEAELLSRIEASELDEHPAYEHYLAARILADTRETARALMAEKLHPGNPS
jgi:hypothetical protein